MSDILGLAACAADGEVLRRVAGIAGSTRPSRGLFLQIRFFRS